MLSAMKKPIVPNTPADVLRSYEGTPPHLLQFCGAYSGPEMAAHAAAAMLKKPGHVEHFFLMTVADRLWQRVPGVGLHVGIHKGALRVAGEGGKLDGAGSYQLTDSANPSVVASVLSYYLHAIIVSHRSAGVFREIQ